MNRIAPALTTLIVALAFGCRLFGGDSNDTSLALEPVEIEASFAQRPPVELMARGAGNRVWFQVANNRQEEIYVGRESFALISPGVEEPFPVADDSVVTRFPPRAIGLGDNCSGEIIFMEKETVVGHRLVYNSGRGAPIWVEIGSAVRP
jgi:hypothetical protein